MKFPRLIMGVQHVDVGISTSDLNKAVAFYREPGFEVALEMVNEAARIQGVEFLLWSIYRLKKSRVLSKTVRERSCTV